MIDLCDEALAHRSVRQQRFEFLRGDPSPQRPRGLPLPVDAYYPELALVIEYREIQHTKPVPHFDKPGVMTVSGCDRRVQRSIYDQRRRDVLKANGIRLVEIDSTVLDQGSRGRLRRNRKHDAAVLRSLLDSAGCL